MQRKVNGEKTLLSTNGAITTGYPYAKIMNLNPYLPPYIKINSKWITVKVKQIYKTLVKLLEIMETFQPVSFQTLDKSVLC